MRVGIGLPSSVAGVDGSTLLAWARRAEERDFTSLGVVDRVRYTSYEPMTLLAAVAGVTARIRLVTMIVIAPLRSTATLAAEAANIDALSSGRLTLGLGLGARRDDYLAADSDHRSRGRRFTEQLQELRDHWEGDGRASSGGGPQLVVGGTSDVAFARAARYADGYVHGGGPPRAFVRAADRMGTAWVDAARPGRPALWAQGYFALGDESEGARGRAYMRDYYAFTGPFVERIVEGLLVTPQQVLAFVRGYEEAGCDELVLLPALASFEQVDRLAEALV